MKNNMKGITLIALIITIIILLILAVITIGSIKNNNIITYAQNAVTEYNKRKGEEELSIEKYEKYIEALTSNDIWEYAWVCRNGVWDTEYITNINEVPYGDGIIVVNFYRKENQITPSALNVKLKKGNAYKLIIEGSGEMGSLYDENRVAWSSEIGNWLKNRNEDGYIMAYITDILIEEGINSIGQCAFDFCVSLENIIMPNSLVSIDSDAFNTCEKLKEIDIPNSVISIGDQAFVDCPLLEKVIMPKSLINIGLSAFQNCPSLKNIEIPDSVESIGGAAFYGCSSLKNITIPAKVTTIDCHTFGDCTSLEIVEIPNSVESIGFAAFDGCSSLKSVKIPNTVTIIEDEAFDDVPEIIYNGDAEGSPWGAISHKKQ